ncbi:28135_t:CDS:2 [Racocetra persica]|uniref:28135_t:CDS:1 n=1 Tax=Racocetra persica TaxID=160502 RepID=A0ACA9PFB3_9GLOM|nr:28135_t:CDS:2 [Racocetra persica]
MTNLNKNELAKIGVQFGNLVRKWNPKMRPYIYGKTKNKTHILNLQKIADSCQENKTKNIPEEQDKKHPFEIVKEQAIRGFLTNFGEIKKKLRELQSLNTFIHKDSFKSLIKKEQVKYEKRRAELQSIYEGVVNLRDKPDVLFIIGLNKEKTACLEAKKAKIPVIAFSGGCCHPGQRGGKISSRKYGSKRKIGVKTSMSQPRFFTGIQASGALTLGNYLGLIRNILEIQEEYEVIIMICDLHSLTIPKPNFNYREIGHEIASLLYACGLKEENCKIFIQSEIKEHVELAYLLSPHITVSALSNMIQYKEKKREQESGNLALLTYPVLMAADIFLYDADLVIVGQDQTQHLELTTNIAQKFNNFYGQKLLKIPQFTIPHLGAKIMDLKNPQKKMSKSENDFLALLDNPQVVAKKIKEAETDSENRIYYDPTKKAGISNLLTIYALLSKQEIKEAEKELQNLNYHQFKLKLIDLLNENLGKIHKKYIDYQPRIKEILKKNTEYLKILATQKLNLIKKEIKFN